MPARRRRVAGESEWDYSQGRNQEHQPESNSSRQQRDNHNGLTRGQGAYSDNNSVGTRDKAFNDSDSLNTTMTSRDRTHEFANAIRSMQSRTVVRAAGLRNPRQARSVQSYSNFMMVASNIGKNLASTYAKLEKLALLAKKKSIFDDRQLEIEELTSIIKADIGSLNQQIARLQDLGREQHEIFSSSKSRHIASHSSSVVVALQTKLANMSNKFKTVLEIRSAKMKEEQSRREQFTQGNVSTMLPLNVGPGKQGSLLLQEDESSSSVSINLEPSMRQISAQSYAMKDDTDSYLQQRAETMQNIESTIVELGGIFQQLAVMVKEQEEMVARIDSNVEDTELNVEAAHAEILKYFQSVTNNRWLMIKIFGVLIFFFIFFVVFLA